MQVVWRQQFQLRTEYTQYASSEDLLSGIFKEITATYTHTHDVDIQTMIDKLKSTPQCT